MTALLIEVIVYHRLEPRGKALTLLCVFMGPFCPFFIAGHLIIHADDECKECEERQSQRPAPPPPVYDPYDVNNNPALPATEVQPDGTLKVILPNLVPTTNGQPGQDPGVLPESELLPDGTTKLVGPGGIPSVDSAPVPEVIGPDGTMQPASPVDAPLLEYQPMPDGTTKLAPPGTAQAPDSVAGPEVPTADDPQARDQESQFEPPQDADSPQLHRVA